MAVLCASVSKNQPFVLSGTALRQSSTARQRRGPGVVGAGVGALPLHVPPTSPPSKSMADDAMCKAPVGPVSMDAERLLLLLKKTRPCNLALSVAPAEATC